MEPQTHEIPARLVEHLLNLILESAQKGGLNRFRATAIRTEVTAHLENFGVLEWQNLRAAILTSLGEPQERTRTNW